MKGFLHAAGVRVDNETPSESNTMDVDVQRSRDMQSSSSASEVMAPWRAPDQSTTTYSANQLVTEGDRAVVQRSFTPKSEDDEETY